jgi:hypothetical protein
MRIVHREHEPNLMKHLGSNLRITSHSDVNQVLFQNCIYIIKFVQEEL